MSELETNELKAELIEARYLLEQRDAEIAQLQRDKQELAEACDAKRIECERLAVEEMSLRADLMMLQRLFYDGAF